MNEQDKEKEKWRQALGGATFGLGHIFDDVPTLYQYTNLSGLVGIIESNQIWATDMRYLNDITEAKRLWTFMASRIANFRAMGKTFANLDLQKLEQAVKNYPSQVIFVASFSEARDSLGQWRAYGGINGVCIAFKKRALHTQWVANPKGGDPHWTGMLPYKVKYMPDDDSTEMDQEIERLLETGGVFGSQVWSDRETGTMVELSREDAMVNWLRVIAVSFKHDAFADEREWRLCYQRHHKPMRHQRFRVSKSTLIPYIAANLNVDIEKKPIVEGSFIEEVIIAPSPNMELTQAAVEQLLLANGHEGVPVRLSAVPYRDW